MISADKAYEAQLVTMTCLYYVVENIGNDPILQGCKPRVCPIQIPHKIVIVLMSKQAFDIV